VRGFILACRVGSVRIELTVLGILGTSFRHWLAFCIIHVFIIDAA
jgi:hypothetical protein